MLRFKAVVAAALLAAGCASAPSPERAGGAAKPAPLPSLTPLPATLVNAASCPGCLAVTLTLRPDGSFLSRERVGAAEFYDFGRWKVDGEVLQLDGDRDRRRHPLAGLKRASRVEALRGPFRMVGLYDGEAFMECRTGVAWRLADTRAAQALKEALRRQNTREALVALDAQLEGSPEVLRVFRPASILKGSACDG